MVNTSREQLVQPLTSISSLADGEHFKGVVGAAPDFHLPTAAKHQQVLMGAAGPVRLLHSILPEQANLKGISAGCGVPGHMKLPGQAVPIPYCEALLRWRS